jgi:hypothetical protein
MYDKSILAKSTGASLGVVAVVGMLFLSTGTAFAIPISGIGGFNIQATEIRGENLKLYPGVGAASGQNNITQYPTGVVELTSVDIDGLLLTKVIPLPSALGFNPGSSAQLVITSSGTVSADTLLLKTPKLSASDSTFNGLVISESPNPSEAAEIIQLESNEQPTNAQGQTIPFRTQGSSFDGGGARTGLVLQDAQIQGVYLATNQINIPGLSLEVQADLDGDTTYEYQ